MSLQPMAGSSNAVISVHCDGARGPDATSASATVEQLSLEEWRTGGHQQDSDPLSPGSKQVCCG